MIKSNIELYAPVKGYEGLYEVSTWGNVRSLDRYVLYKDGKKYFYKGINKILNKDKNGYLISKFNKNNLRKNKKVHRLVAEAFIPNPNNYPIINHRDEDKSNNRVDNLEWCTVKYNNNYGTVCEKISKANTNGKKSKPVYQYDKQCNIINLWPSVSEAGRNGFDKTSVYRCCVGKRKTYKSYIWSYEELN